MDLRDLLLFLSLCSGGLVGNPVACAAACPSGASDFGGCFGTGISSGAAFGVGICFGHAFGVGICPGGAFGVGICSWSTEETKAQAKAQATIVGHIRFRPSLCCGMSNLRYG